MKKIRPKSGEFIEQLEETVVNLSIQLKRKEEEVKSVKKSHKKLVRRLIHDLKTPSGIITSFSEMILDDIEDYNTDKLRKHIGIIKKAADYSIHFLNRTVKYLRLQSPEKTFLFDKLNYIDLLNQVINKYKPLAAEKGIRIVTDFEIKSELLLLDEEDINEALSNVLGNAIRYSNDNTTVLISVVATGNNLETLITDGGIGVSQEDIPKIFDAYFVVKTYANDKKKCVGLGLAMAKIIIEQHKGTISFESELGKGSKVKITLPRMN